MTQIVDTANSLNVDIIGGHYRDYHCRKQDSDNQHCGGKGIKGQAGYYIRGKAGR